MDFFKIFENYCPLKSVYENKKQLICFPYVAHGEPLAVYFDKESKKYREVFFFEDNTIQQDIKHSKRVYGENMKVSDSDDLQDEYEEEALEEEYRQTIDEYIAFFGEDPHIGDCTDLCPRPIPKLIEAMKRAIKRGSKLRHIEIYGRGGGWGYRNHIMDLDRYKVLETENYLYWYYPPICEGDCAKILQRNKSTKEEKWVREIDVRNDLSKATVIGTFDPEDPSVMKIKVKRSKK